MVGLIKGRQRVGKTTWLTGLALHYCWYGGYIPREIISNYHLYNADGTDLVGYLYLSNDEMKRFLMRMIEKGYKHLIILIDEIDRVFSHRSWHNQDQINALTGLWQDEKLFHQVWGTAHIGLAVDSLIREISQVEIIVHAKNVQADSLSGIVINNLNKEIFEQTMHNMSLVQKCFNSWEPIK